MITAFSWTLCNKQVAISWNCKDLYKKSNWEKCASLEPLNRDRARALCFHYHCTSTRHGNLSLICNSMLAVRRSNHIKSSICSFESKSKWIAEMLNWYLFPLHQLNMILVSFNLDFSSVNAIPVICPCNEILIVEHFYSEW